MALSVRTVLGLTSVQTYQEFKVAGKQFRSEIELLKARGAVCLGSPYGPTAVSQVA